MVSISADDRAASAFRDRPSDEGGGRPWAELSDDVLMRRSVADAEQFAPLFDRHAAAVHNYLARRIGGQADDLLAETFLIAFRRRATYQPRHIEVRPWLIGISTNLLRRYFRQEKRRYRALARLTAGEYAAADEDEAVDRADAMTLRRGLADALAKLKRGDLDVLLLTAWADMSSAEIATVLSIPVGTVRSRLHRARRLTREALSPGWIIEETS